MRLYKCDICGEPIESDKVIICKGCCDRHTGFYGVLSQSREICETCIAVGEELDFEKIMLDAWRKAVYAKQAK